MFSTWNEIQPIVIFKVLVQLFSMFKIGQGDFLLAKYG